MQGNSLPLEHILWSGHSVIATKINGNAIEGGRLMTIDRANDVHIWKKTAFGWEILWKGPVADLNGFANTVAQVALKVLGTFPELNRAWNS